MEVTRVFHYLWTLLQEVISLVFVIKKVRICVRFWTVTELCAFLNSRTRPRVNRVLRNQLAGDVPNLVAYRLRCKHYFCHLTRPPCYRQYCFRISSLGSYLGNAEKVGWVGGYSPGQCILYDSATTTWSKKPLSLTLQ